LTKVYQNKLMSYKKKYPGWKVRDMENLIINRILSNYDPVTKKVYKLVLPENLRKVESLLRDWMYW
jgi:hypothetical protein